MKVGISACSNGHLPEWQDRIKTLKKVLASMNIEAALVTHIIKTTDEYSGTDKERAEDLMNFSNIKFYSVCKYNSISYRNFVIIIS